MRFVKLAKFFGADRKLLFPVLVIDDVFCTPSAYAEFLQALFELSIAKTLSVKYSAVYPAMSGA
jgi:hypothetical protein